jgi:Spy/CpxP family protein refolding chaperone
MRKQAWWGTGLAVGILVASVFLTGCGHGHWGCAGCGRGPGEWVVNKIASELDLTTEQKTKLSAIRDELVKKQAELKPMHQSMRDELRPLFLADTLDQDKVNQVFTSRQAQYDDLRKFLVGRLAEFHDLLTPAQRAKAVEKMEAWEKQMQEEKR